MGRPILEPEKGKRDYRAIVEDAIGISLPPGAVIHHVDEDRSNNRNSNLVVCPDEAYHNLLHMRLEAQKACGNANWKKCYVCKQYDDEVNLKPVIKSGRNITTFYHAVCRNEYRRNRYKDGYAR
jgi:hypothetical protein